MDKKLQDKLTNLSKNYTKIYNCIESSETREHLNVCQQMLARYFEIAEWDLKDIKGSWYQYIFNTKRIKQYKKLEWYYSQNINKLMKYLTSKIEELNAGEAKQQKYEDMLEEIAVTKSIYPEHVRVTGFKMEE